MRESIGSTFTLNIIILFIIIVFGILAATLSYYKAYKVNNRILDAIEQYEGYNNGKKSKFIGSEEEIERILSGLGYPANAYNDKCTKSRDDMTLVSSENPSHFYCVYYDKEDNGAGDQVYENYAVVTYIYMQLPIIGALKFPVYTKGERIYKFSAES